MSSAVQRGLYGKLPMKRDFIAVSVPDALLELWEPWLQAGLAASRLALGGRWQEIFLKAPIWRFWLGPELCGRTSIGSFTPSVDAIGRLFPLTVFVCAEPGTVFPAPRLELQADWFAAAEAMLLYALDESADYDSVLERLQALPPPVMPEPPPDARDIRDLGPAHAVRVGEAAQFDSAFVALATERQRTVEQASCFFWTIGGEDFPPVAVQSAGLPDPTMLTALLNGDQWLTFEDLPA